MDAFRRIAVVGTGLIGGSILRRLHESGMDVIGYDPAPETTVVAERLGLPLAADLDTAVEGRDLVVGAAPLAVITDGLPRIAAVMDPGGIVTDVGSTKSDVARAARPLGARFIGGHPMAGTERSGLAAADPTLFDGAAWVLCPPSEASVEPVRALIRLITEVLGARVIVMDADRHDETVALSSHIPHVLAGALAGSVARSSIKDSVAALAAGSFRDGTRVAGTHPDRTVDMLLHNRQAILDQWGGVQGFLDEVLSAVRDDDRDALTDLFTGAADLRRTIVDREPAVSTRTFVDGDDELDYLRALGAAGGHVVECVRTDGGTTYAVRVP